MQPTPANFFANFVAAQLQISLNGCAGKPGMAITPLNDL
jgi:hypothetical protein